MGRLLLLFFLLLSFPGFGQKKYDLLVSLFDKNTGKEISQGSVIYEGDQVKLKIKFLIYDTSVKPKFLSILDYVDTEHRATILFPLPEYSESDFILKNNSEYSVDIIITPPFGSEYLTVLLSDIPIKAGNMQAAARGTGENNLSGYFERREEKESPVSVEDFLLLIKGSPLSTIFEKERKEGTLIFKSFSFQARPKEEKNGFLLSGPADSYFTNDSSESFTVPVPQSLFNRSDFPVITIIDSVFNSNNNIRDIRNDISGKFLIQGTATDIANGIKSITINDKPVQHYTENSGYFDYNLPVKFGTNFFKVSVENNKGFIKTNYYRINYILPPPTAGINRGVNHLLLIGADKYLHWPKLQYCRKELADFKKLMIDSFGYNKDYIYELTEQDYSRKNLTDYLGGLLDIIKPEDNLLIFYAGHGSYDARLDMGYWIPLEGQLFRPDMYYENVLLSRYLSRIKAKRVFVIADACYSGSLVEKINIDTVKSKLNGQKELSEYRARLILASGGLEKVPDKLVFAQSIMNYLKNNPSKKIYASELISLLNNKPLLNGSTLQNPIGGVLIDTKDQNGDFLFERRKYLRN